MGSEDRKRIIDDLNAKYHVIVSNHLVTMDAAYGEIVKGVSYNCGLHPLAKVERSLSTTSRV